MANFHQEVISVTIAITTAVSGSFSLYGRRIAGIVVPSAWTAADISFEVDADGSGTFVKVVGNDGALVKLTGVATAVSEYQIPPEIADIALAGELVRLVSTNTASEVDINQDAARTLKVVAVPW